MKVINKFLDIYSNSTIEKKCKLTDFLKFHHLKKQYFIPTPTKQQNNEAFNFEMKLLNIINCTTKDCLSKIAA